MDDNSITLSDENSLNSDEEIFGDLKKKIKSESKVIENINKNDIQKVVNEFYGIERMRTLNQKTDMKKLIRSIKKGIKGNNSKEISLKSTLKDEDFDYLKSIIVKKKSKIDYEKTYENVYELRENYEEEEEKPKLGTKKRVIRLRIVRKPDQNKNVNNNTNEKTVDNNNNATTTTKKDENIKENNIKEDNITNEKTNIKEKINVDKEKKSNKKKIDIEDEKKNINEIFIINEEAEEDNYNTENNVDNNNLNKNELAKKNEKEKIENNKDNIENNNINNNVNLRVSFHINKIKDKIISEKEVKSDQSKNNDKDIKENQLKDDINDISIEQKEKPNTNIVKEDSKDDKLLLNKDDEISETKKEQSINKDDNIKIKQEKISSEENKGEKNEIHEHEEKKHKHEHEHEHEHKHKHSHEHKHKHSHEHKHLDSDDKSKSKETSNELTNKSKDKDNEKEKDKSNSKNKKDNNKSDKSISNDNKKPLINIKKEDKTQPKTNKIPLNKKKESNDSSHNNVNKKEIKYPIENYYNYQKNRKYTFTTQAKVKKIDKGATNTFTSKKNINENKNAQTKNNPISLRNEEPTKGFKNKELYSKSTRNITSFYNYNQENKMKKNDKNLKKYSDKKLLNKTTIFNNSKVNIKKEEKEKEKIPKTTINKFPYLGSHSNKNVTFYQYKNDSKILNKQDKNIKEKKNKKDMFSKEKDEKKKMNKTFIK